MSSHSYPDLLTISFTAALRWILVLVFSWLIFSSNWGEGGIFHYASIQNEIQRTEHQIARLKEEKQSLEKRMQELEKKTPNSQLALFRQYGVTVGESYYKQISSQFHLKN